MNPIGLLIRIIEHARIGVNGQVKRSRRNEVNLRIAKVMVGFGGMVAMVRAGVATMGIGWVAKWVATFFV